MANFLGDNLRKAFDKLTGSSHVDSKELDEFKKDIQRALISSDVNVKAVMHISKEIEKKASEDIPKGLSKKEFLVKNTYDVIASLLGAEKPDFEFKPEKVLMLGLFGSGKCVHPDSKIVLTDGRILRSEDLYENYKHLEEQKTEGGKIITVKDENILVPSFNPNTLKIENKTVSHLWKLEGKELIEVKLDNGNDFSVKVTPEHPFFVLRNGVLVQVRADELNYKDFIATPARYETIPKEVTDLSPELKKMDLTTFIKYAPNDTLKHLGKTLSFKRNYCSLTSLLKQGETPIELANIDAPEIKIRLRGARRVITFPTKLTEDLAEFIGYVIGDGHLEPGYVQITNEDKEVINRVKYLSNKLFGIKPAIKNDKRSKNLMDIRLTSTTLVLVLSTIFNIPIGKKGKKLSVPILIAGSSNQVTRKFLQAYFDCDASATPKNRSIEITSESQPLILEVCSLLLRFGIKSTVSRKYVKDVPYWRLTIKASNAEKYASQIGFSIIRKQEIADSYEKIGLSQGKGKQDGIPLGPLLKKIRTGLGFSIGEIQETCNSYGEYERTGIISRESLAKVVRLYEGKKVGIHYKFLHALERGRSPIENQFNQGIINSLIAHHSANGVISEDNGMLVLTAKAQDYLRSSEAFPAKKAIAYLKKLCESDVSWPKVRGIRKSRKVEYVYDLTVEDNHSFIADNIIVHNTTSTAKLARLYKRKNLSVGVIGADVWRPAAFEQLKQLSEKAGFELYGDPKEKDPSKIVKKGLEALKGKQVIIVDSAGRSALDQELINELKEINSVLKPTHSFLVLSADIGQVAGKQAEAFHYSVGVNGVILTKTDGSAKGGGAISACSATLAPVHFIGTGEKLEDLEQFDAKRYLSRIMGYGDLEALLEKVKDMASATEEFNPQDLMEGDFTMEMFYKQMKAAQKMGPLGKVMDLMGLKQKMPDEVMQTGEKKLQGFRYIMESMTKKERKDVDLLDKSRIERIAKGSGTKEEDVRELIKSYKKTEKMFRMMRGGRMSSKLQRMMKLKGIDMKKIQEMEGKEEKE